MENNRFFASKSIVSLFLIFALFVVFVKSDAFSYVGKIFECLYFDNENIQNDEIHSINDLENDYASQIWLHNQLIDLNGKVAKCLKMRGFYGSKNIYVSKDMYILGFHGETSTDYEVEQMISFSDFLEENGINLLYVNAPVKYLEDSVFINEFGLETYSNRNADIFLERINDAGINYIDLRTAMKEQGIDVKSYFYRTDHHWTVRAGLWSTKEIAEGLNYYCGYQIDTAIYNDSNFVYTDWVNCWLGEQGKKISKDYIGLDDFTEIKPIFPTSYVFKSNDGDYNGTFDDFIDESVYDTEKDVYENSSWHYSYKQLNCVNTGIESGKLLLIGDSYSQVMEPFLSLGIRDIDYLILRQKGNDFNLRQYIIDNGYDTVLICYNVHNIGEHDNPKSANYKMFTFD